eukprot:14737182-Heterocapsa_arctica.AAC.1
MYAYPNGGPLKRFHRLADNHRDKSPRDPQSLASPRGRLRIRGAVKFTVAAGLLLHYVASKLLKCVPSTKLRSWLSRM